MSRYDRVRTILGRLLELGESERAAALDRECGDDRELRREVETLLTRLGDIPSLLATGGAEAFLAGTVTDVRPESIGPYRILEVLGEGGMGTVFLAEQSAPIRRRVAVKLIKPGQDTRQVIARFEAERQALALMSHPGIAAVHDAGSTDAGRPYFVMEYVPGKPITEHCDEERLGVRDRLALFVRVCRAIHHAHQRGIIHRDVKASNVLVCREDGRPVPKVIDFGVAKAMRGALAEATEVTEFGQLVGTPEYMSPEQAAEEADVDVTTDVYALGVLLYRLLAGALPFDSRELRSRGPEEVRRVIREVEPPPPSARVRGAGEGAEEIARRRGTTPRALVHGLRGEPDWITMRAMAKDRTRRYPSASELAEDVERHLSGEPVSAGPPSARYRLAKLVRRHRGAFAAAALVFVALAAGLASTTVMYRRAEREGTKAASEARKAERINEFLQTMLASADPEVAGRDVTVRDVLQAAADSAEARLGEQPEILAAALRTLGNTYDGLGLHGKAVALLRSAAETQRAAPSRDDAVLASCLNDLAVALNHAGELEEARRSYEEALVIKDRLYGRDHVERARTAVNLAVVLKNRGEYERAESLYRESIDVLRRAGRDEPFLPTGLSNLAVLLRIQGRNEEAAELYREALSLDEMRLGDEHPFTNTTRTNLATALYGLGRYAESESIFAQVAAVQRRTLGDAHPGLALTLSNLAGVYLRRGDLARAEPTCREALAVRRVALGEAHPDVAKSLTVLGEVLLAEDRASEAEPVLEEAVAIRQSALPAGHPDIAVAESILGSCLDALGRGAEAESLLSRAWTEVSEAPGAGGARAQRKVLDRLVAFWDGRDAERAADYRRVREALGD